MVSRYGWSFQHQVPSLYVAIHLFVFWDCVALQPNDTCTAYIGWSSRHTGSSTGTNSDKHASWRVRSILKQRVERLESATQLLWAGIDRIYFWELQLKGIHPGAGVDANIFPASLCFLLSSLLKDNRGMLPTENRTTLPNRTDTTCKS